MSVEEFWSRTGCAIIDRHTAGPHNSEYTLWEVTHPRRTAWLCLRSLQLFWVLLKTSLSPKTYRLDIMAREKLQRTSQHLQRYRCRDVEMRFCCHAHEDVHDFMSELLGNVQDKVSNF